LKKYSNKRTNETNEHRYSMRPDNVKLDIDEREHIFEGEMVKLSRKGALQQRKLFLLQSGNCELCQVKFMRFKQKQEQHSCSGCCKMVCQECNNLKNNKKVNVNKKGHEKVRCCDAYYVVWLKQQSTKQEQQCQQQTKDVTAAGSGQPRQPKRKSLPKKPLLPRVQRKCEQVYDVVETAAMVFCASVTAVGMFLACTSAKEKTEIDEDENTTNGDPTGTDDNDEVLIVDDSDEQEDNEEVEEDKQEEDQDQDEKEESFDESGDEE